MKWKVLKHIRVVLSLVFFLLTFILFVDAASLFSASAIQGILYLQLIPSLIRLVSFFSLAAAGVLFITGLTVVFGRIYCSSVCPLGTLQDIFIAIRTRIKLRTAPTFRKPLPWVSYPVLGIILLSFLFGNLFLITLLDPFSLAGKFFSELVRPVFTLLVNPFPLPGQENLITMLNQTAPPISTGVPLVITGFLFVLLGLLSVFKNRWYCTVVCPVGTLLGLISRFSLYRIRIDDHGCIACGTCTQVCKSDCIDLTHKQVDFSRCVACFNCVRVCENQGISYTSRTLTPDHLPGERRNSRRDFLKTTLWTASSLILAKPVFSQPEEQPGQESPLLPAIPPGSVSISQYTRHCTACQLCVSNCPTSVLQPALIDFGLAGILQPKMDFETGYCAWECKRCLEVCPTQAILPLSLEQKKRIRIGQAKLIKNLCIPVCDRKACGFCAEKCPVKAIDMQPFLGDLAIPHIDEETCNGCGICEYICPTRPIRAIYVEPLSVHRIARKPRVEKSIPRH